MAGMLFRGHCSKVLWGLVLRYVGVCRSCRVAEQVMALVVTRTATSGSLAVWTTSSTSAGTGEACRWCVVVVYLRL